MQCRMRPRMRSLPSAPDVPSDLRAHPQSPCRSRRPLRRTPPESRRQTADRATSNTIEAGTEQGSNERLIVEGAVTPREQEGGNTDDGPDRVASNMAAIPPHGPLGMKNSASSRPVAYPPPITTALKANPGSRKRWNREDMGYLWLPDGRFDGSRPIQGQQHGACAKRPARPEWRRTGRDSPCSRVSHGACGQASRESRQEPGRHCGRCEAGRGQAGK